MRWFKGAAGLLVIVLLAASCIKVDAKIKIEDDGSGSVDFLTAVNPDALTSIMGDFDLPDTGAGTQDICDEFAADMTTSDIPAGGTVLPYAEDGFCGSRLQLSLSPSTDHSVLMEDIFDERTRLYKEGDNWIFESDFNTDEITGDAEGAPDAMFDALFGEASFQISVDLPGRAIPGENNATAVGDDGLFIWDIDILNPPTQLIAKTEPGSGGGTDGGGGGLFRILAIVAALAVLAAGAWWFLTQRKSTAHVATADATADTTSPLGQMPLGDGPAVAAQAPLDPVYDEALGAWTVTDPARGRLRHDPQTDTWSPI